MARNQQLKVLQALDVARTQLYHFTAIVIAGMGFFTDAYDLFSISLVVDLIGYRYYPGSMAPPTRVEAAIRVIALCGTVPGQLVFGWLGDNMGRKRIYGVTLLLMVFCSLASGFSFSKHTPESVVTVLCLFRFLLGVGIGGDYPLSATIMSEYANKRTRGGFMAAVFAMQGFGILAAGLVGIITSKAFEHSSRENTDYVWRIVLMFGAIPALLTYYWRMKMPETARYTALVTKDEKKAVLDMSTVLNMDIAQHEEENVEELPSMRYQYGLFSAEFLHHHGLHLLGTSITWFLVDITFYSLNMCMKQMFSTIMIVPELGATCNPLAEDCPMASPEPGYYQVDPPTQLEQMIKITGLHTVIALLGTLPGYFFTVAFIDRFGRVKIQLFGFTMMTLFVLCLAIPYDQWVKRKNRIVFAIMYAFTFFFANFGPNTTTFIVSAELFPARLRSTCHGISGAAGKIGAILGVLAFSFMKAKRYQLLLFVLVGCNLVGILFTLLLPETKGKSLEEITGETEEGQPLDDEAAVANTMDDIHTVHVTGGLCGEVV